MHLLYRIKLFSATLNAHQINTNEVLTEVEQSINMTHQINKRENEMTTFYQTSGYGDSLTGTLKDLIKHLALATGMRINQFSCGDGFILTACKSGALDVCADADHVIELTPV